jgi:hypothetical protein
MAALVPVEQRSWWRLLLWDREAGIALLVVATIAVLVIFTGAIFVRVLLASLYSFCLDEKLVVLAPDHTI